VVKALIWATAAMLVLLIGGSYGYQWYEARRVEAAVVDATTQDADWLKRFLAAPSFEEETQLIDERMQPRVTSIQALRDVRGHVKDERRDAVVRLLEARSELFGRLREFERLMAETVQRVKSEQSEMAAEALQWRLGMSSSGQLELEQLEQGRSQRVQGLMQAMQEAEASYEAFASALQQLQAVETQAAAALALAGIPLDRMVPFDAKLATSGLAARMRGLHDEPPREAMWVKLERRILLAVRDQSMVAR